MRVGFVMACAMAVLAASACGSAGGELATQNPAPYPTDLPTATATFQMAQTALPTLTPTLPTNPAATETPETTIIDQRDFDLKGNIGSVEVDFLWIKYARDSSYRIKIYQNTQSRPLLWQSDNLDASPFGYTEVVEINGQPWIIAYWASGFHSLQVYPIRWDGTEFHAVATFGMDNQPANILCDDGVIHFSSDGYITAFFRSIDAPPGKPSADITIWMLLPDGFHAVREYEYRTDTSDTTPPTIQLQSQESPDQIGWYEPFVHLTLSASDNDAVQSITYSLKNANSLVRKTAPLANLPLDLGEGRWSLAYYATDMADNIGNIHTEAIMVDGTAPVVATQIIGKAVNGWYPAGTSLVLHATDPVLADGSAGSGIDRIEYSRDDGSSWESYVGGIVFSQADKGVNTILYRAIDRAGNRSETQSIVITIGGN